MVTHPIITEISYFASFPLWTLPQGEAQEGITTKMANIEECGKFRKVQIVSPIH